VKSSEYFTDVGTFCNWLSFLHNQQDISHVCPSLSMAGVGIIYTSHPPL